MKRLSSRGACTVLPPVGGVKRHGDQDNTGGEYGNKTQAYLVSREAKQFSCSDLPLFRKDEHSQCLSDSTRSPESTSRDGLRCALSESMNITDMTVSRSNSLRTNNALFARKLQLDFHDSDDAPLFNVRTKQRECSYATRSVNQSNHSPLCRTDTIPINTCIYSPSHASTASMREEQMSVDMANVANSVVVKDGSFHIDGHEGNSLSLSRAGYNRTQEKFFQPNNDDLDVVNMSDPDDSFEGLTNAEYFELALRQATFTPHTPKYTAMNTPHTPMKRYDSFVSQKRISFCASDRYECSMKSIIFDSKFTLDN